MVCVHWEELSIEGAATLVAPEPEFGIYSGEGWACVCRYFF